VCLHLHITAPTSNWRGRRHHKAMKDGVERARQPGIEAIED